MAKITKSASVTDCLLIHLHACTAGISWFKKTYRNPSGGYYEPLADDVIRRLFSECEFEYIPWVRQHFDCCI